MCGDMIEMGDGGVVDKVSFEIIITRLLSYVMTFPSAFVSLKGGDTSSLNFPVCRSFATVDFIPVQTAMGREGEGVMNERT